MLSPEDIAAREFLVSLRGYDRDEVTAFLARVAEEVRLAHARVDELDAELQAARAELSRARPVTAPPDSGADATSGMFAAIGQETQRILEAAQEAGAQIQSKARRDAELRLESAQLQAERLVTDAERRRDEAERIVERLRHERAAMAGDLREVMRMIDQTLRSLAPLPAPAGAVLSDEAPDEAPDGADASADDGEPEPAAAHLAGGAAADAEADRVQQHDRAESQLRDEAAPAGAAVDTPMPTGAAVDTPAPSSAVRAAGDDGTDGDGYGKEAQRRRSAALAPLQPPLVRRVKRELQEVQNIALDRVRRARGQGSAESFLPDAVEVRGLGAGSAEHLEQAWRAGVAAASALASTDLGSPPEPPPLQGVLAADAIERVRVGLAATLRRGLSAEESEQALSERIGAVFGELKGGSAEELVASHLVRAYELGLLQAWRGGGVPARRWVLGREPRCPEARCRSNDQTGPLIVTEPFPSGHEVPPVHLGCTCATVPVLEPTR